MRIVAGKWRGRTLSAPRGTDTRPTSDRVREAVFDAVIARGGTLEGAHVLDVFAGTGAMGLEALSRGAAKAVFIDSDRAAIAALRRNAASLGAGEAAVIIEGDVRHAGLLDRALASGPFALLVLDPPYRIEQSVPLDVLDRASGSLQGGALAVWEHSADTGLPVTPGWHELRTYRYGGTAITFLERDEGGAT